MDRKVIVELFRNGMKYPVGKHQICFNRCFEITVRPDKVVEVDEYESFNEDNGLKFQKGTDPKKLRRMFHVGRSVVSLKDRRVIENASGDGWRSR